MTGKIVLAIFLIMIIGIPIFSITKGEPVEVETSLSPCLGRNICFPGEILKLNVKVKPSAQELEGKQTSVKIESPALEKDTLSENITIGTETSFNLPLGVSLQEGPYKIRINTDLMEAGGFVDYSALKIKHFLTKNFPALSSEKMEIEIKYPKVEAKLVTHTCLEHGFKIEEIKLKLEEETLNTMDCRIRIYTNALATTHHPLLTEKSVNATLHYYETNVSSINKQDLTGAIQKITFEADQAVQQIDTSVVPVCKIGDKEIEISQYKERMPRCNVNKEQVW